MWRYFNVGAGVFIKYTKSLPFHLAAVTITLYVRQLPKSKKEKTCQSSTLQDCVL